MADIRHAPPLTHSAYSAHCSAVAASSYSSGQAHPEIRVQAQLGRKWPGLCARIVETTRFADARQAEWCKVEFEDHNMRSAWLPINQVRVCSQVDGQCSCVEQDCAL